MTDKTQGLFDFDNSYARLPEPFYARLNPTPVKQPELLRINEGLAVELGLDVDRLRGDLGASVFSGNVIPHGAEPLAQAYAGHQFGNFVPQLGDGRAILLGEIEDRDGQRRDVQLKGSGPTPFSRGGDGRAALGPVLREYLVSEAMHALGVPTTRALAAVTTGEHIFREGKLPGAILTRVAHSHLRVGTLQYFAARSDADAVRKLVAYAIERHYPEAASTENPALALLRSVMERQSMLVARWLGVGFIHGVMNTDNTSLSGQTIDYGPCAFMDVYDPATVFSSIDHHGRYAFAGQPQVAGWNMARFAEAILAAIDPDPEAAVAKAQEVLVEFAELFQSAWVDVLRGKLGITRAQSGDFELASALLDLMAAGKADYTNTFRALGDTIDDPKAAYKVLKHFSAPVDLESWHAGWRARLSLEDGAGQEQKAVMRRSNPAYIPRNHRVEEVLAAAIADQDLGPFEKLLSVLARPYDEQPESAEFSQLPEASDDSYCTYCGT